MDQALNFLLVPIGYPLRPSVSTALLQQACKP